MGPDTTYVSLVFSRCDLAVAAIVALLTGEVVGGAAYERMKKIVVRQRDGWFARRFALRAPAPQALPSSPSAQAA